jgi:hypothetical protein
MNYIITKIPGNKLSPGIWGKASKPVGSSPIGSVDAIV